MWPLNLLIPRTDSLHRPRTYGQNPWPLKQELSGMWIFLLTYYKVTWVTGWVFLRWRKGYWTMTLSKDWFLEAQDNTLVYQLEDSEVKVMTGGFSKLFTCLSAALGPGCGMEDLWLWRGGSSSLTRDWTWAPCFGNAEYWPLDHQGLCVCMLSRVLLFVTLWTIAHQAPLHEIFQARVLE